ncbi:Smr/MutS family protein [Candidatus Endowatersipora endosymbiont of Watersipora subatra]|uniref:Smr/MutS family protein n=1 Tax=Candidatus Endowatersipora endosymbiont of Watersipora subatra TaxID=3077946 RepID=UPI00312C8FAA
MVKRELTDQEYHLWKQITDTTTSLKTRESNCYLMDDMTALLKEKEIMVKSSLAIRRTEQSWQANQIQNQKNKEKQKPNYYCSKDHDFIERSILRKISKGHISINARLDLHGMTQEDAKNALHSFLINAQKCNHHFVLVITGTGKGRLGSGILRQMVPIWLNLKSFLPIVNGYKNAHSCHGGQGAFYVRIRRHKLLPKVESILSDRIQTN